MEENIEEIYAEEEDKVLYNPNSVEPDRNIFDKFGLAYQFCFQLISSYGWYIVIFAVITYYLYKRNQSAIHRLFPRITTNESHPMHSQNPDEILARQEAMEASRRKMQDRLDRLVEEEREKQKQREETKRKEKIEEWDRFQAGGRFRSRNRLGTDTDEAGPSNTTTTTNKKTGKDGKSGKSLRGEFNPLLGPSGGSSYRPSRRGMSGGG